MNRLYLALAMCIAIAVSMLCIEIPWIWVLTILSASLVYGSLSPVIAARKLYFLSASAPHTALFAVALAIPIARAIGIEEFWLAVIMGVALLYVVGYLIHKGTDPDVATSILVAFTASGSVLALYYVLTRYSVEYNIWAVIVGDPLLVSQREALISTAIAIAIALGMTLSYREHVCLGIDRDFVQLAGVRTTLYDIALFTFLAIATVALIKIVGFVLEHVMLLLPAAIAMNISESSQKIYVLSIAISVIASLAGLYLAIQLDIAPAGSIGLTMLSLYIAARALRKVHSHA